MSAAGTNEYKNRLVSAVTNWKKNKEGWYPTMLECTRLYYENPTLFKQTWKEDGAARAEERRLPPLAYFKGFAADMKQHLPALRTAQHFFELCPHNKQQLRMQLVAFGEEMVQQTAQGLEVLEHLQDTAPSKGSRDGWANLHHRELVSAITDARAKSVITPTFTINTGASSSGSSTGSGGSSGSGIGHTSTGMPPTYDPADDDIQSGVAMLGISTHLAKQQNTGLMQANSCKMANQLITAAITAAADDRSVADPAVSSSWRFRLKKFLPLALEFLHCGRKLPASIAASKRRRQAEEEDEDDGGADASRCDEMERLLKENRELMQELESAHETISRLQGQLDELRSPRAAADP
jgi:hypothetical protein